MDGLLVHVRIKVFSCFESALLFLVELSFAVNGLFLCFLVKESLSIDLDGVHRVGVEERTNGVLKAVLVSYDRGSEEHLGMRNDLSRVSINAASSLIDRGVDLLLSLLVLLKAAHEVVKFLTHAIKV
jgi:hypothetical protein